MDSWTQKRRENAAIYDDLLKGSAVKTPTVLPENYSIYHQYTIAAPKRDELQKFLADKGISSAVFYPWPLHLQECFAYLGYKKGDMPISEETCLKVLSLPVYPELEKEKIEYVAKTIREFYS